MGKVFPISGSFLLHFCQPGSYILPEMSSMSGKSSVSYGRTAFCLTKIGASMLVSLSFTTGSGHSVFIPKPPSFSRISWSHSEFTVPKNGDGATPSDLLGALLRTALLPWALRPMDRGSAPSALGKALKRPTASSQHPRSPHPACPVQDFPFFPLAPPSLSFYLPVPLGVCRFWLHPPMSLLSHLIASHAELTAGGTCGGWLLARLASKASEGLLRQNASFLHGSAGQRDENQA